MVRIELSKEIEKKHLDYFKEKIAPNFDCTIDFKNNINKNAHGLFIDYCKRNITQLAIGKPKELLVFADNLPSEFKVLFDKEKKSARKRGEMSRYNDKLYSIFGYDKFCRLEYHTTGNLVTQYNFKQIKNDLEKCWNPYSFVMMSGIRACPYCNRQYITPLYINSSDDKGKLRADLDHFFPKSSYPFLSMSLYNLVPCCKFCNSSLKGVKEFEVDDINPYDDNYDDYFHFEFDPLNDGDIVVKKEKNDLKADRYLKTFKLEAQYGYHKNQANELLMKRKLYPDSYITELFKKNAHCFASEKHIRELIVGYIDDCSKINNEVLLKFRRDIAVQLGFIETSYNKDDIRTLEDIHSKM